MPNVPIRKAVIPVAGLGTRMLPATKAQRKEMLPVAGKPLVQYSVEEAAASGIETIVLVTGDRSASLVEHFKRNVALEELLERRGQLREAELVRSLSDLVTFCTVEQPSPHGLGHAVYCALEAIGNEPFVLLLPDVIIDAVHPCAAQLIDAYHECGGSVIAVRQLHPTELQRHGVVTPANAKVRHGAKCFRIISLVEKPKAEQAPSEFGVFGRYLLQPSIFRFIERNCSNNGAEIQLTDSLNLMAKEEPIHGFQFSGEHFDAGDKIGFLQANIWLSLKDKEVELDITSFMRKCLQNPPNTFE
jgi:UTP--glucose-1-phosphate uridylyltransferase